VRVVEQVRGQVDVGALLFRLDHADGIAEAGPAARPSAW
jgi:hypothetical protein